MPPKQLSQPNGEPEKSNELQMPEVEFLISRCDPKYKNIYESKVRQLNREQYIQLRTLVQAVQKFKLKIVSIRDNPDSFVQEHFEAELDQVLKMKQECASQCGHDLVCIAVFCFTMPKELTRKTPAQNAPTSNFGDGPNRYQIIIYIQNIARNCSVLEDDTELMNRSPSEACERFNINQTEFHQTKTGFQTRLAHMHDQIHLLRRFTWPEFDQKMLQQKFRNLYNLGRFEEAIANMVLYKVHYEAAFEQYKYEIKPRIVCDENIYYLLNSYLAIASSQLNIHDYKAAQQSIYALFQKLFLFTYQFERNQFQSILNNFFNLIILELNIFSDSIQSFDSGTVFEQIPRLYDSSRIIYDLLALQANLIQQENQSPDIVECVQTTIVVADLLLRMDPGN